MQDKRKEVMQFCDDLNINYCLGNAILNIVRCSLDDGSDGNIYKISELEDAKFFINYEIEKLKKEQGKIDVSRRTVNSHNYTSLFITDGTTSSSDSYGVDAIKSRIRSLYSKETR